MSPVTSAVRSTPPALIVTAPLVTEKLSELKLAIPLLEVVASSPAIVTTPLDSERSIPSPSCKAKVSDDSSVSPFTVIVLTAPLPPVEEIVSVLPVKLNVMLEPFFSVTTLPSLVPLPSVSTKKPTLLKIPFS